MLDGSGSPAESEACLRLHDSLNANPLVSVIVPTFNQKDLLVYALRSVVRQTYRPLEVIVSDDCSRESLSQEEIKSFSSDVSWKYFYHSQNVGRVANYRFALHQLSEGKYATNVDGDDMLLDACYIERAVSILEANDDVSLVTSGVHRHEGWQPEFTDGECYRHDPVFEDGTTVFLNYYQNTNRIHHLTTVFRRALAVHADFYRLDVISADVESILRILPGWRIVRVRCIAGFWRSHGENASKALSVADAVSNLGFVASVSEDSEMLQRVGMHSMRSWYRRMLITRVYGSLTTHFWRKKRYRESIEFFRQTRSVYGIPWCWILLRPRFVIRLLGCWFAARYRR